MKLRSLRYFLVLTVLFGVTFLLRAALPTMTSGTWVASGNLSAARAGACAVVLKDGRLLVSGGADANGPTASADLFSTTGIWSTATPMNSPRSHQSCAVLQDGRVLVAGGATSGGGLTNSAEIYDPTADSWTHAGIMNDARSGATASVLQDGRILIAGGQGPGAALNTIEIFDPNAGTFSSAGAMSAPRQDHAAAVLIDGRVLIAGGSSDGANALNTTEIYDPQAGSIAAGPTMSSARAKHTATTLLDGTVAVIGGSDYTNDLASAVVFDPAANTFSAASALATARSKHSAFLLPDNNQVLVVGGQSAGADLASAELYVPWQKNFQATGAMTTPRSDASGASLTAADGYLLMAGGTALSSTELYAFPTVKTDAADYAPGTVVNITGSGWQPGETVTLTLVESPLIDTHPTMTAVADSNGNISNSQFSPDAHDVNVRFYLTAVGGQSGAQAQNTFTDATKDAWDSNPNNYNITLNPGQAIPTSGTNQPVFAYTVTQGTGSSHVTFPVNAGVSVTGATWASPSKSSINISSYTSGDSASVIGTVPCSQAAGVVTLKLLANLTNNTSVLNPSSMSNPVNITVTSTPDPSCAVNTTTAVTTSANPSVFGQSVTFTATVTPASGTIAPTGTVQFVVDGANFGSPLGLVAGSATSGSTSTLSVGGSPHSIVANYTPGSGFASSSGSLAGGQTVSRAGTTTALSSSANPSAFGQSVTFTASVTINSPGSGSIPSGETVTFNEGTTALGTGTTNASGAATFATSTLSVTTHSITAVYAGDTNFGTSTSPVVSQVVSGAATITSISAPTVTYPANATITVSVSSTAGTPGGNVSLTVDGGTPLSQALTNGAATFTLTSPSGGTHTLSASYAAQGNFAASSATGSLSVNQATPTVTFTGAPSQAAFGLQFPVAATTNASTTATITASGACTISGNTVTMTSGIGTCSLLASWAADTNYVAATATQSTSALPAPVSVTVPDTTVTYDGTPKSVTPTVTPAVPFTLTYTGISPTVYATSAFAPTEPGSYTALAAVIGPNYQGSGSGTLTINKKDPALQLALMSGMPDTTSYGSRVYFELTTATSPCPTGQVDFFVDGGTTSSLTVPLSDSPCTHQPIEFSTATLTAGSHSVSAVYSGDAHYINQTSAPVSHTVVADTTTVTLASSATEVFVGDTVTLTATVTPDKSVDASAATPTGKVQFSDNTTTFLGESPLSTSGSAFVAVLNVSTLPAGPHSITATYVSADGDFLGNSSPVSMETVDKIAPAITWPNPADIVYGTKLGDTQLNATAKDTHNNVTVPGTFVYDPAADTVLAVGTRNISVKFTPTDTDTYTTQSATATINVTPATLAVKADDASRTYGADNPTFTFQYSGFVNSETQAVVTTAPTCSTTATATSPASPPTYAISCSGGAASNYSFSYVDGALTITKATPTVTVTDPTPTYDGSPHSVTATAVGVGGAAVSGTFAFTYDGSPVAPTNAKTSYAVVATFTSTDANYTNATGNGTLSIKQATPIVTVNDSAPTYDANPHSATAIAKGVGGTAVSGTFAFTYDGNSVAPTNAKTSYAVVATFSSNDPNYTDATGTGTLTIKQATPIVAVNDPAPTYDGNQHSATATAKGVGGAAVAGTFAFNYDGSPTAPINAKTSYAVVATFTSTDTNYTNATGNGTLTIKQATPVVTVTDPAPTYDANPHSATATAKGVGGAAVSGTFTFTYDGSPTAPINAKNAYAVVATFSSNDPNYTDATGTGTLTIKQATPIVAVSDPAPTYDGSSHVATATAKGVGGAAVAGTFAFNYDGSPTAPINAKTSYAVLATFTSTDTNYTNATGNGTLTIKQATPVVTVTDPAPTYDANPHSATATAKGIGGTAVSGTFAFTYDGSPDAPTNAKTSYAVVATFTSTDTNYTNATANGMLTIKPATPLVTVTDLAPTYDGSPHSATAAAKGIGGIAVNGTFAFTYDGNAAAPTNAKTSYAVVATLTSGDSNYVGAMGTGTLTIKQAMSTTTVTGGTFMYDGNPHPATVLVTGPGSPSLNPAPVYAGACSAAPVNVPDTPCNASYTYPGDANHTGSTGSATITITKAPQTITWPVPTSMLFGTALSGTQLNATVVGVAGGSAPGALTYTPGAGTVLPVGSQTLRVDAAATANYNAASKTVSINVFYSTGLCDGDYGHQILQPINSDGTSVFKQKSTVPAKFRVCDAAGNSIGTAGVVSGFTLLKTMAGTVVSVVDETVDSTTPDTMFRWDPTSQQWIFNINTKNLNVNVTYYYVITLNDGSTISFMYGLK